MTHFCLGPKSKIACHCTVLALRSQVLFPGASTWWVLLIMQTNRYCPKKVGLLISGHLTSSTLKWLGASQTTSRESGCPTRPPQIWPGASLRDYISCLQVLVWPPGPNQLIQAVKRQFEANFVIFTGWMLAPITPKVVGQNPKYFRGLMYS